MQKGGPPRSLRFKGDRFCSDECLIAAANQNLNILFGDTTAPQAVAAPGGNAPASPPIPKPKPKPKPKAVVQQAKVRS